MNWSHQFPSLLPTLHAIEKGDFLQLSDPMTVSLISADNQVVAGIAAEEKVANDGKTTIAVYLRGIFKVEVGTTGCSVGKDCVLEAKNEIKDYDTLDDEVGRKCGKALETGTDGEFVAMLLQIG